MRPTQEKAAFAMGYLRKIPATLTCCLVAFAVGQLCSGQEFFPGNIFELRPPHVRLSEETENSANPRGGQSFGYFEAPPAIPPQSEVRLTEEDSLSLVYPAHGGSFFSGGSALLDRLRVNGTQLNLDLFHFTNSTDPLGNTLVPPAENSLFIGQLSAGEYKVNIRDWYLPWDILSGFDPATFEPPSNAVMPSGQIFSTPLSSDDLPTFTESSFQFLVLSVPEASTLGLAVIALLAFTTCVGQRLR